MHRSGLNSPVILQQQRPNPSDPEAQWSGSLTDLFNFFKPFWCGPWIRKTNVDLGLLSTTVSSTIETYTAAHVRFCVSWAREGVQRGGRKRQKKEARGRADALLIGQMTCTQPSSFLRRTPWLQQPWMPGPKLHIPGDTNVQSEDASRNPWSFARRSHQTVSHKRFLRFAVGRHGLRMWPSDPLS